MMCSLLAVSDLAARPGFFFWCFETFVSVCEANKLEKESWQVSVLKLHGLYCGFLHQGVIGRNTKYSYFKQKAIFLAQTMFASNFQLFCTLCCIYDLIYWQL